MGLEIYNAPPMHAAMLGDTVRNSAFARAIAQSVRPGDVVLDVGAGTGVLAMMAAQAGAARVYAVEASPIAQIAQANAKGFGGRITVIKGRIEDVILPEPVDIIVSEWLGAFGIDENLLPMALIARDRWLKPGGKMLPLRVTALAMPVDVQALAGARAIKTNSSGAEPVLRWSAEGLLASAGMAPPQSLWATDVDQISLETARLPARGQLDFTSTRSGHLGGFATWFDAEFGDGTRLSNAPGAPPTHWGQFIFTLTKPQFVEAGSIIKISLITMPGAPGWCHHSWSIKANAAPMQWHDTRGQGSSYASLPKVLAAGGNP
jgi:protein-L-isoaspartate O-methyltransferase